MRTAIITEIKGLSIQTQQNTFVLFTLFKLTSDERKTLTKISTHKTSHNHSPNQRMFRTQRNKKTSKQPNKEKKEEKAVCIIGGESEALGFHQKIQERRNNHQYSKENKRITIGFV